MVTDHPDEGQAPRKDARRRPYRTPRIVDYGSIPARTLGMATGSTIDAMAMPKIM